MLALELPGLSLEWLLTGQGDRVANALAGPASNPRVRRYDGRGARIDPLAVAAPQEAPTDRSTFLRGSIGLALMAASADPVVQAIAHLCSFEGRLSGETVDGFDELIADLGHDYARRPPRALVVQLQAALSPLTELIAAAPTTYRNRLESAAGWLAALLANALHDSRETTAAKMRARAAFEHGQRAGDDRLIAFVLYKQAAFAWDADDYDRALQYVDRALMIAPRDAAITCRLLDYKASLHARHAQRGPACGALVELERQFGRLRTSEVGNGSFSVSPVFVADALRGPMCALGDLELAERYSRQVIDHYAGLSGEAQRPTRLAYARINLAGVMVRTGRLDEACDAASEALGTERMVPGLLRACGAFDATLAGRYPDLQEARDFHERYITLARQQPTQTVP